MFLSFPHQMWGVVESHSNLTPRGLETPLATSEYCLQKQYNIFSKEIFESFLVPQRTEQSNNSEFEYMIFVWNGRSANALVKAQAVSNAFELENLLNKGREYLLQILFSGGVIRNKKLQKGSIIQFNSAAGAPFNQDIEYKAQEVRETVYLFNFLFPQQPDKRREFSKLSDFLQNRKGDNYQARFPPITPELTKSRVPALNFMQLPQVPKFDLNLKNAS